MGWRLFRRIKLFPGLRLNLSKSGPSLSLGGPGAWLTLNRRGRRQTIGVPGTGVSHTTTTPWEGRAAPRSCGACGDRIAKTARFCPQCGTPAKEP